MIWRGHVLGYFCALLGFVAVSPLSYAQEPKEPMVYEGTVGGLRYLEEGQPPAVIHATVEDMKRFREANPNARPGSVQPASTSNDLYYHGGTGGTESKRPRKSTWSSGVRNGTTTTRVAKQPFWRTSTAELAAAPGSIALPNIARASPPAPSPVALPARTLATRPEFLPESGRTTQALRRRSPSSHKSRPRPSAPHSTSATPPLPATPPSSM
jgi:hypothetical protein